MAQSNVDVIVKAIGVETLTRLDKQLTKIAGTANKVDGAFEGLKGTLGNLAALGGISLGFGKIFTDLEKADKAKAALRTLGIETKTFDAELTNLRKSLNNNVSQLELQQGAFAVAQAGFKKTADQVKILEAAVKSSQAKLVPMGVSLQAILPTLRAYGLEAGSSAKAV